VVTGPVAKKVGSGLGIGSTAVTVWDIAKWPIMAALVLLAIAILYFASPNAKMRGFASVFPGAGLAMVVWLIASALFAFYVANFGSYNKTYGALGGVIIFLVWLWITNVAIVLGAEFNAEHERSKQLEEGTSGADRELQVDMRDEPKHKKRSRTALNPTLAQGATVWTMDDLRTVELRVAVLTARGCSNKEIATEL